MTIASPPYSPKLDPPPKHWSKSQPMRDELLGAFKLVVFLLIIFELSDSLTNSRLINYPYLNK